VKGVVEGAITEAEATGKIQERGINFFATPENLARLRAAGATPAILEAIRKLAPEAPKPTAALVVTCFPAECVVRINGRNAGTTTGGKFQKDDLDVGEATVGFEKDGYVGQERKIQLTAEAPYSASIQLEPDTATRQANGKNLFLLSRRALGVESDLKSLQVITGSGAVVSYAGGKQSNWNFDFTTALPNLIEMKAESTTGVLVYQCQGEKCAEKKKGHFKFIGGGKQLKGPALEELQTNLRGFAQYSLADLLTLLASPSAQFDSLTADSDGKTEQLIRIETRDAIYKLTLGPDLLPSGIDYESKSGLGSGLKVLFGDYAKLGNARYPKRTTIRLPDAAQHGIEVRLDKVAPGSELKESDFAK